MSAPEPIAPREVANLAPSVNPAKPGNGAGVAENGTSAPADASFALFGKDGFSFFDLVDIINPLQHIPIVSSIYRHLTGDELDAAPRVLGGALFGGAIGAVAALVNVVVDEATGKDIGDHALAFFVDEKADGVAVAAAPSDADFDTAGGADELPWGEEKDLGEAMPWLAADNAAVAAVPVDLPSPAVASPKRSSGLAQAADAVFARAAADFDTAAGAGDELPWRKEKDLGDAMPWLVADKTGGASGIGAPDERTGPWVVQAFEDARAIPGNAGSDPASRPEPRTTPDGAVAAEGGWFADVMLAALQSYERGATLSGAPRGPAGGVTN